MVLKIRVPFWVPEIIGAVLDSGPKRDHIFDNHLYDTEQGRRVYRRIEKSKDPKQTVQLSRGLTGFFGALV